MNNFTTGNYLMRNGEKAEVFVKKYGRLWGRRKSMWNGDWVAASWNDNGICAYGYESPTDLVKRDD